MLSVLLSTVIICSTVGLLSINHFMHAPASCAEQPYNREGMITLHVYIFKFICQHLQMITDGVD